MNPLRQQLADAIATTMAMRPFELVPEGRLLAFDRAMADAAIPVFAAWLRDEGDQARKFAYHNAGNDYLLAQAGTCDLLAAAIDPRGTP